MSDSDSGDEGGLEALFAPRPEEQELFYFCDILISDEVVTFVFRYCDDRCFESQLALDGPVGSLVMRTLFSIGMCVCSWYWMGFNTTRIVISEAVCLKCSIGDECMDFWRKLYEQIALEYAYVNKTPLNVVEFVLEEPYSKEALVGYPASQQRVIPSARHSTIIPMGGGKDSLVVWQQYVQQCKSVGSCNDNARTTSDEGSPRPLLVYVADGMDEYSGSWRLQKLVAMTGDSVRLVRHDFQTQLLHRRKRSYLKPCAHPWAALVLFDSVLAAQMSGVREVRLGYERSADEGNGVFVQGREVNHQYDKSSAFLQLAQAYVKRWIDPEVSVTSTLHGLWEIQIARIFCEAQQLRPYLPVFLSCNDPTERCDWCKRCEKCAFIFLLLAAWLPLQEVTNTVFGGVDMLSEERCRREFRMLVGLEGAKPLDCVGTVAEASAAVHLAAARICGVCVSGDVESGSLDPVCDTGTATYSEHGHTDGGCADASCSRQRVKQLLPPILWELCEAVQVGWDPTIPAPALRDPDAILARWGVDK